MPADRPPVPAALARAIRLEAGHRCAIPTCRATSGLQIHHIADWAKVREHTFANLILLCANCHARVTSGEIDRRSVVAYKANLGLLASRYGDLERRVLQRFVNDPALDEIVIDKSHAVLLDYLIEDGLLAYAGTGPMALWFSIDGAQTEPSGGLDDPTVIGPALWRLTDGGRQFVAHLRDAHEIE